MRSLRTFAAAALLILAVQPLHAETGAATDAKSTDAKSTDADAKSGDAAKSSDAKAAGDKATGDKKKFTKSEIEAFLTKCSVEADEKGLTKAKNKLAERKAFRRQCMSKFGVEPK